jgi:hypothetical protein
MTGITAAYFCEEIIVPVKGVQLRILLTFYVVKYALASALDFYLDLFIFVFRAATKLLLEASFRPRTPYVGRCGYGAVTGRRSSF